MKWNMNTDTDGNGIATDFTFNGWKEGNCKYTLSVDAVKGQRITITSSSGEAAPGVSVRQSVTPGANISASLDCEVSSRVGSFHGFMQIDFYGSAGNYMNMAAWKGFYQIGNATLKANVTVPANAAYVTLTARAGSGGPGGTGTAYFRNAVIEGAAGNGGNDGGNGGNDGGNGGNGVKDHGQLTGLNDDDHPQYLNTARGDARYYTKTNLETSGQANVHWNNLTNVPDLTGGTGFTDHGALTGLGDDDHPQYLNNTRGDARYYTRGNLQTSGQSQVHWDNIINKPSSGGGGGVSDHGALTGLGDDDHTQYHNDARGDARYYTKSNLQTAGGAAVHWNNIINAPTIGGSASELVISVKSYGAVGNGTTDDTSAIQNAVSYAIRHKATLVFETGKTYKISSSIKIGRVNDGDPGGNWSFWTIDGNGCTMLQAASNTPIFLFNMGGTPDMCDTFTIKNFLLRWSANQTASHPNSFGIGVRTMADNGYGISNCTFENIYGLNGYTLIGFLNRDKINAIWGATFKKLQTSPIWRGRVIDLWIDRDHAHVNINIEDCHFRGDVTATEELIRMKEVNLVTIDNIEIIRFDAGTALRKVLYVFSSTNIKIGRFRVEVGSYAGDKIIHFNQVFNASIDDFQVQGMSFTGNLSVIAETSGDSRCFTEVHNVSIFPITVGTLNILSSNARGRVSGGIFVQSNSFNYTDSDNVEVTVQNSTSLEIHGNENVTLSAYDCVNHAFNTTLTANRTVTLPTTGVYNGLRFRIVRRGLGNFTLAVGSVRTIPANTAAWVEVIYKNGWNLVGYGTL